MPPYFFKTPRLLFRPFLPDDLDALAAISGDPAVARFVGDGEPLEREIVALWIERSRANVVRFGYGTGAVIETESDRLIGFAGLSRPEGSPEEIVYGFEAAAWGKGYGSEIARGLVDFLLGLGRTRLRATVYPENAPSIRILERLGFVRTPWERDAETALFLLEKAADH